MKAAKFTKETISSVGVIDRQFPEFKAGDSIAVSIRVKEGDKERLQIFEGDVIAINGRGDSSTTFVVRRIASNSIAVERIFPYHSPLISSIKVIKHGDVRRAKLFYVRDRVGKAARFKEKVRSRDKVSSVAKTTDVQDSQVAQEAAE
jgi:ribosomal protein L19, bacterial type